MTNSRELTRRVHAHTQTEGAGFTVRRPFPTLGVEQVDPFLLLDEMGPVDYAPGAATGAPDHPHRGFETVTYVLEGEMEHEDSAGNRGVIRSGDVQWMTAGAGVVHSEMPSRRLQEAGGRVHGFQIWVNLPQKDKMIRPRYQEVPSKGIPVATSPDGLAKVKVVAGEALGVCAVIDTHTPITYQHWTLQPGADVTSLVPAEQNAFIYVFQGAVQVGEQGAAVADGNLGHLGSGDSLRLRVGKDAKEPAELLLLGGVPIREPLARYGPFVMNTREELIQAFQDFQSGRMGEIAR